MKLGFRFWEIFPGFRGIEMKKKTVRVEEELTWKR